MSFQTPLTLSDILSRIREHRLLLPAIQREFVWQAWQIEWLFDSLMQGYPFGSFLFWEIRDDYLKDQYKYYEFILRYRQYYNTHNPYFNTTGHRDFEAVLDGQQRLTAIYIGLLGTYAYRLPRIHRADNEYAIPTRRLYLNIKNQASNNIEEEVGRLYEFSFLTNLEYNEEPSKWFLVGDILKLAKLYDFNKMMKDRGYQDNEFASRALSELHSIVHMKLLINYYLVKDADLEKALNVFVRVNAGGEKLSLSDMLMSTAIANWNQRNAKEEIFGLIDKIKSMGFFTNKDLILKICLYLYSSDIRYKVSNFSAAQVKLFEDNWECISDSIIATFTLLKDFGFEENSLTSKNALLPIIYWIHHKSIAKVVCKNISLSEDRRLMKKWLHSMLLKGVFGGSSDTVLSAIRKVFTTKKNKPEKFGKPFIQPELVSFPVQKIASMLKSLGKDPDISEDFINSLLYTKYNEKHAFSILSLLSPDLDYKNGDFHQDHLHPASSFRTKRDLKTLKLSESSLKFYLDPYNWNSILNLRHLDANENKSKKDKPLNEWVSSEAKRLKISTKKFCIERDIPPDFLEFSKFEHFICERRELLKERLISALI